MSVFQPSTPKILHQECLPYEVAHLDAPLWRFFRWAGYVSSQDTPHIMVHEANGQVITRLATPGEVAYGIALRSNAAQLGAFVLLPQIDGSTLLQVVCIPNLSSLDATLVHFWREAWNWIQTYAGGLESPPPSVFTLPLQQPFTA